MSRVVTITHAHAAVTLK